MTPPRSRPVRERSRGGGPGRGRAGPVRSGEAVEVYLIESERLLVHCAGGEVGSVAATQVAGAGVRVVVHGREGFAAADSLDPVALREALEAARAGAAAATGDWASGVAEPDGAPPPPAEALYAPGADGVPLPVKVQVALDAERSARSRPGIVATRGAKYAHQITRTAVATSTGVSATSRSSLCHLGVTAVAEDGDGHRTGSHGEAARHPDRLDAAAVGATAASRARRGRGARPAPSGEMTVLFEPRPAAELLGRLVGACDAEAMRLGRSMFTGAVGTRVAAPIITIVDDPADPRSATAQRHDGEGLWSRRHPVIEDGVLVGALHTSTSARRVSTRPTASASRTYTTPPRARARSLRLLPGRRPGASLPGLVGDGLRVWEVTGLGTGVNLVNGTFSVGVEGELLRGGAPAGPVRATTVAGTLQRLLTDAVAVGDAEQWLPSGSSSPHLVVAHLTVTGR